MPSGKPDNNTYPVVVDYGKSVEEMVRLGKYSWSDGGITSKKFPTKRTGKEEIQIVLVHFDQFISTEEAIKELDEMGFRPAELRELLAFGEKYPNIQRKFPVVALGSVRQRPDDRCYVQYLSKIGCERDLILDLGWDIWREPCRFAAVAVRK